MGNELVGHGLFLNIIRLFCNWLSMRRAKLTLTAQAPRPGRDAGE
jgi:uncharacterized protein YjiS (DUF1127 family)